MKKALSIFLCLIIIAGMFAACGEEKAGDESGLKESEFIKSDKNDDFEFDVYEDYSVVTGYTGEDFRVSVPSKLGGKPVRGIGEKAIGKSMLAIEVVDIPAGVVYIDPSAFSGCNTVTTYTVSGSNDSYKSEKGVIYSKDGKSLLHYPAGRTDEAYSVKDGVEGIGDYAFSDNEKITKITLPESVTGLGAHAFEKCDNLYSVVMPDGIKNIGGYAFYECMKLVVKSLPSSLETIGEHAFDFCHSIAEVSIPDSVHDIGDCAFYKCESLKSVFLPASLTKYGYRVFAGCKLLNDFTISPKCENFTVDAGILYSADRTELVEYPYGKSLEDVSIADSVKTIRAYSFFRSFEGYEDDDDDFIKKVNFNSVEKIGAYAFANRKSLTQINLPATIKEVSATAFNLCTNIASYNVEEGAAYVSVDGVLFTADKKTLVAYPCAKKDMTYSIPEGVEHIGDYAFSYNSVINTLNFAKSIKTIGNYAFYSASTFGSVVEFTENLESIGEYSFSRCLSVEQFIFKDNTIKEIPKGAFEVIDGAYEFIIPKGVTKIGEDAFRECGYLSYIEIPDTVTEICDRAFYDMDDIHKLTIPASVTKFGVDVVTPSAESDPDKVTVTVTAGSAAEEYCKTTGIPYVVK